MLVLSRKKGERICVGPDVTVTVLRVSGHTVKIGIEAPDGVQVFRAELIEAVPPSDGGTGDERRTKGNGSLRGDAGGGSDTSGCGPESSLDEPGPDGDLSEARAASPRSIGRVEVERAVPCPGDACGRPAYRGAGRLLVACR